eukprot:3736000-Rhodomonas_salina.1
MVWRVARAGGSCSDGTVSRAGGQVHTDRGTSCAGGRCCLSWFRRREGGAARREAECSTGRAHVCRGRCA